MKADKRRYDYLIFIPIYFPVNIRVIRGYNNYLLRTKRIQRLSEQNIETRQRADDHYENCRDKNSD